MIATCVRVAVVTADFAKMDTSLRKSSIRGLGKGFCGAGGGASLEPDALHCDMNVGPDPGKTARFHV
jgi:hypothetical protein